MTSGQVSEPGSTRRFPARELFALKRLLTDRGARYELLLRHGLIRGGFQSSSETCENRYPRIFAFIQSELGDACSGRILSFGCANGDEAFTLRRYFPKAEIKGVDINPANIAICRRRLGSLHDSRLSFDVASSTAHQPTGHYDAIFCMAVLRHGSLTLASPTCLPLLRFDDFTRAVADFHRCLRPGGLLVVRHSNFRLCDAPAAAGFESIHRGFRYPPIPLFGPDNALLPGARYPEFAFRKR